MGRLVFLLSAFPLLAPGLADRLRGPNVLRSLRWTRRSGL